MTDDIDFKSAMRGVRPLKKETVTPQSSNRPTRNSLRQQLSSRALQSKSLQQPDDTTNHSPGLGRSSEERDNELFFVRQGIQKKVLRDLKKGKRYPYRAKLDLHGLTQHQARREIGRAIVQAGDSNLNCLLIVHGKGLHSGDSATLKRFTATHLKNIPEVRAYCSAQKHDGGTGALYVLLRS